MCGIAGIYKFNKSRVLISELKQMTDTISHRGPDGEGQWINAIANVGFGHRRLSIIDLSEQGKQPMHYANERYTITFNGEIYNYIELRQILLKKGYQFVSDSDTEVLMALYDLKKEDCLDDLDGMFAFAIWDEKEQILFCARDRFGEKPFHYFFDGNQFVFASEIKQFWSIEIEKQFDQEKLLKYAKTAVIEDEERITETFYRKIKKLDAAHCITINADKKINIKKYWDIDLNRTPFTGTIDEAAERFLELFTESVRLRLRSDVPVGSSLSGGLDSSSIVMLIDLLKGKELKQNTFSARFKDFSKDEGVHIETVVKACKNMQVHYTWPDSEYFETVFDKVVYHQDEPFGSASIIAQYAVMELAKKNDVTVLLDGQGADEQLAGYLPYYHDYLRQLFYSNTALYSKEYEAYTKFHGDGYRFRDLFEKETMRMKLGRYKVNLLNKPKPYQHNLKNALKQSTLSAGLKELLRYADRNSMAHSREVRLPFLSHKLVEFVFSLPDEYKLNNGWTKFVLRKSMNKILPESICWRVDKIGYEPPQKKWIESDKYVSEIVKTAKFLNIDLEKNYTGKNMFTQEWRLLMASKYI
jgi:asparagine synthase (glutamine-hydrolysing)